MAKKSVTPELDTSAVAEAVDQALDSPKPVQLALVDHYIAESWESNPMSIAITNRLHTVDRCLAASAVMNNLLHRDLMAKVDIESQGSNGEMRIVYPLLKYDEADSLFLGMQELLAQARETMESIRDDAYGIATRQSKGEQ